MWNKQTRFEKKKGIALIKTTVKGKWNKRKDTTFNIEQQNGN